MRGEMTPCQPIAAHLAHVARVSGAVWVPNTLGAAARDGVGLGHQAGLAPADGVTWGTLHFCILEIPKIFNVLKSEYSCQDG